MTFHTRFDGTQCAAFAVLCSLFILSTTGCDSTSDRACSKDDDCFVGEVCIDNLCVTDPGGDTGETDTAQDTGNDTGADTDQPQDSGPDDTGQDTQTDTGNDTGDIVDTGGEDSGQDTGQDADAGIDTDRVQACNPSANSKGNPPWLLQVSTVNTDKGRDVAIDDAGNAYVVGSYTGTLEIADCTLYSAIGILDRSTSSALLIKLSPQGEVLWAKGFTDPEGATTTNVAVTPDGAVVITGYFDGIVDFGGGTHENEDYASSGINSSDIFVARFTSDGMYEWSTVFNGDQVDRPEGIAVDDSENVYLTGYFEETLTVGATQLTSQGLADDDVFLAKLDSTGTVQWATRFGGDDRDRGMDIDVDGPGNIYLIGEFEGTASFGTGDLSSNNDSHDVFVAKYSTEGDPNWVEIFGGQRDDMGEAIAYDDTNGAIYVTGGYRGDNALIGQQFMPSAKIINVFLARYASDGSFGWAEGYGGDRADRGFDVVVDDAGNPYIAGTALSEIDFGDGDLNPNGGAGVFVAGFNPSASLRFGRAYGNLGEDSGMGVAATSTGQVYVTGYYNQTFTFDSTDYSAAGNDDMFILSIDP